MFSKVRYLAKRPGFTLIELLVVISIIALLIAILMPALNLAREQAKKAVCLAHLKGLGAAMLMYADDNNDTFHNSPNHGRWVDLGSGSGNTGAPLKANDPLAYWGIAYFPYAPNRDIFACPSMKKSDVWWELDEAYLYKYCSYGINIYICGQKITQFKLQSEMIIAQDHIEQKLDDNAGGDMFYIQDGQTINLVQWRNLERDYPITYADSIKECWRHNSSSNTLWLDGHSSPIKETTGEDIPAYWYKGN